MNFYLSDVLKLGLAILVGGIIGIDREFHDKAAGFRTLILICLGSTLFTIFSLRLGGSTDGTRIAANIVSGVGFLGAGVILRDAGRIVGLTTASAIWLTAAMGMGIGGGYYWLSAVAIMAVMLVLLVFPRVEAKISAFREMRTYEVVTYEQVEKLDQLEAAYKNFGLHLRSCKQARSGTRLHWTLVLYGSPQAHEQFTRVLIGDIEISEFRF